MGDRTFHHWILVAAGLHHLEGVMKDTLARDCIILFVAGFAVTFALGELYIRFWS